jgi:hypothetical protein
MACSTVAFGADIDFATLAKIYGPDPSAEKGYSRAVCLGCETKIVSGDPNPKHISCSSNPSRSHRTLNRTHLQLPA